MARYIKIQTGIGPPVTNDERVTTKLGDADVFTASIEK